MGPFGPFLSGAHEMSKVVFLLNQVSQNEVTADFCEKASPQFVDNQCARIGFYSSRWACVMRPEAKIKNAIDFAQSSAARMIYNLKKVGVIFENEKPLYTKIMFGHISMRIDAIIARGFPDFPNERGLLFIRIHDKASFAQVEKSGSNHYAEMNSHILMAYGGFKKSAIINVCPDNGEIFAQVVELNLNTANEIYEKMQIGVTQVEAPARIKGNDEKCFSCPFSIYCVAPEVPSPTCRNCVNFIIGDNGFAGCKAKNGAKLSIHEQMNIDKCNMHIFNKEFLSSWADFIRDELDGGKEYVNKITGEIFVNSNSRKGSEYTSYEIYGAQGKMLIGDSKIDKIKKMFNATIMDD